MGWKDRSEVVDGKAPKKSKSSWKDRSQVVQEPVAPAAEPISTASSGPSMGESALQGAQQSLTLGYVPEIQAHLEPYTQKVYEMFTGKKIDEPAPYEERLAGYRQRDVNLKDANPWSYTGGQVGGAVLPAGAGLVSSGAKGAGVVAKLAKATGAGAAAGAAYNPHANELGSDTSFQPGQRALSGAVGGVLGLGTQGLISAAQGTLKTVPMATEALREANISPAFNPDAPLIIESAKKLGTKPTPGMIQDSTILRGLESSLEQSPSIAGHLVRKETKATKDAVASATKGLLKDSAGLSNYEAGQKLKGDISSKIKKAIEPHAQALNELREETKHIDLNPKSLKTISRNIMNIPEVVDVPNSPWASEAKQWANAVEQAKNTNSITNIRQALGNEFETAEGTRRKVLGQVYDKLTQLEENSIKRGVINIARDAEPDRLAGKFRSKADMEIGAQGEGKSIATEMLGKMRNAKKGYATVANEVKDLGSIANLRDVKNPQSFVRSLDKMKSEDLLKKLSNTQDVRLLTTLKQRYPEQFSLVRQKKLGDIVEKSIGKRGEIDVGAFIRNTKSLSPEAKELLFGSKEAVDKYEAIAKVFGAAPEKMGPSGTPQGLQFHGLLNPVFQAQEMARHKLYRFMQTPEGQAKIRQILTNLDRVNPTAKGLIDVTESLSRPGISGTVVERSRR